MHPNSLYKTTPAAGRLEQPGPAGCEVRGAECAVLVRRARCDVLGAMC
jgi:hypothetical protein